MYFFNQIIIKLYVIKYSSFLFVFINVILKIKYKCFIITIIIFILLHLTF